MRKNKPRKDAIIKIQHTQNKYNGLSYWDWVSYHTKKLGELEGQYFEHHRANPDQLSNEGSYKEFQEMLGKEERRKEISLKWRRRRLLRFMRDGTINKILTSKQKEIFELIFLHNHTIKEIARKLDIKRETVYEQLHAVINKLKFLVT